nr:immunoglobulin light chain junction region [Macaca mulatta]MOV60933.1 immunoglobulin light chain junction region [Macaca mulatta]MOV60934.1 immunoglobulin light chain junction region [Macaca mulatta]MOV60975.1 immunoglobulin light chain junction region [Macaca mulatta]MOV61004.1 immunoglobulin light chain junction region [Macaca mulatta]
CMQSLEFPLTF